MELETIIILNTKKTSNIVWVQFKIKKTNEIKTVGFCSNGIVKYRTNSGIVQTTSSVFKKYFPEGKYMIKYFENIIFD